MQCDSAFSGKRLNSRANNAPSEPSRAVSPCFVRKEPPKQETGFDLMYRIASVGCSPLS
jgi:hypothetical protein